jgi:hypothetical protein
VPARELIAMFPSLARRAGVVVVELEKAALLNQE